MVSFHSSRCSPYFDFAAIQPPREIQSGEKLAKDPQSASKARNVIVGFYQPAATVPTTPLFSDSESLQNAIAFLAIRRLEIPTLRSGRSAWSTGFATVRSPASARMSHDLGPAAEWRQPCLERVRILE
jgi:hypothetical protein